MEEKNTNKERKVCVRGIGIGGGCVMGRLRFFRKRAAAVSHSRATAPAAERQRFADAKRTAKERLGALRERALREIGKSEAEIFEIHAMLLEDEDFCDAVEAEIDGGMCAEQAVKCAAETYAAALRALDDEYLSARAVDLTDVASLLIRCLSGEEDNADAGFDAPYILVAEDLTPSETVSLNKAEILGFVTFGGTPSSHTAILARAMGIPALVGIGVLSEDCDGKLALMDAAEGTLTVSPTKAECAAFEEKQKQVNELAMEHERYLRSLINKPAISRSGHKVLIYANVGSIDEIAAAHLNGADGVGLLRSEFMYLSLKQSPSEEMLFESYSKTVREMKGKRIVIRTLDIGADKQPAYLPLPKEENPALGLRGVRVCLAQKTLFKTQLRAILRASAQGNVSVMFPMIVSVEEVRACRGIMEECMRELRKEKLAFDEGIELGVMIETPAAAIMSEEIAKEVDFFSVGTNDLTQYTLAADRQNPSVAHLCDENREPILRLIQAATEAIHRHDGWIGVCGELAADLHLTQRFVEMGVDELSVSVPYLLGLREKVSECK